MNITSQEVGPLRLLLLEDDTRLAGLLVRGFRADGYAVDVSGMIEDAHWLATENPYDVLIFDVMLPDGDGFELCQQLRQQGNWTPVLMLTARDSVNDRVRGLDAGADDYLVKPHSFAELAARVRALVRRGRPERPAELRVGALVLDPATHSVISDGMPVSLSPKEFALLELFMRHADRVLSRSDILDHVWDWAYEGTSNVIDVYVRYLRQKIGSNPRLPRIDTIRGVGYALKAPA
jgi:two-component system OmpR family response regulator